MEEEIIVVDKWNVSDLFNKKFWDETLIELNLSCPSTIEDAFKGLIANAERLIAELVPPEMWEMWQIMHPKLKSVLFDNNETIYAIWLKELNSSDIDNFSSLINQKDHQTVYEFILNTDSYKKLQQQKLQAFKDMSSRASDSMLLQFLSRAVKEDLISLSAPEYILLSGINNDKVEESKKNLVKDGYKLMYVLKVEIKGLNFTSVYVFQNKSIKK